MVVAFGRNHLFSNPQVAVLILMTIVKIRGLDTQGQVDLMIMIKSFNLKDGTFTSGESSARKELIYHCS